MRSFAGDQPDPGGDGAVGHADGAVAAAVLRQLLHAGTRRRVRAARLVLRLPLPVGVPADHLPHGVRLAHRRPRRAQVCRVTCIDLPVLFALFHCTLLTFPVITSLSSHHTI